VSSSATVRAPDAPLTGRAKHAAPRPPRRRPRGFLGWTLDAFDYFLVVMTLTAIAREYHQSDAAIAASLTLTLAFRPVAPSSSDCSADRTAAGSRS